MHRIILHKHPYRKKALVSFNKREQTISVRSGAVPRYRFLQRLPVEKYELVGYVKQVYLRTANYQTDQIRVTSAESLKRGVRRSHRT